MFNTANLDDREQVIFADADEWYATRFCGRGHYDKLGPYKNQAEVVNAIMLFFRTEEKNYPPPSHIASRPFAVYAASSKQGGAHVIVGNIYRDGVARRSNKEVTQQRNEEKARAAVNRKSSRRRNTSRPD